MPDLDQTLSLAKRGKLSRGEIYSELMALAEQYRAPGQSEHQAFAKYISCEGRELYQVMASLPGRDIEAPSTPVAKSSPSSDWHDLVQACNRMHKHSHPYDGDAKANAAAVNAALSTPEGMYLFKMQKRAEQIATGQYTVADTASLDGAEQQIDMRKRTNKYMSEFDHMVRDVRQRNPHVTESQAGDHVRSMSDGMAAWLRHKGKPGRNGLPQDEGEAYREYTPPSPTSGRDGRAQRQWTSPHASGPVTPARTPERASDAPAVKAWNDMVHRMQFECGFSRERSIEILKVLPEGKRAMERMIQAAAEAIEG